MIKLPIEKKNYTYEKDTSYHKLKKKLIKTNTRTHKHTTAGVKDGS